MASRLITVLFFCADAVAFQNAADQPVFEKVCGSCHSVSLIGDFKSTPEWEETVDSMIDRGAKATPAERAAVMRYLARNFTRININAASAAEIAEVLDIPEAAAEKIVAHRPYTSFSELMKIEGIPAAKLEARRDRIAFR